MSEITEEITKIAWLRYLRMFLMIFITFAALSFFIEPDIVRIPLGALISAAILVSMNAYEGYKFNKLLKLAEKNKRDK